MAATRLELRDVSVGVGPHSILENVNLKINAGEVHVLLGQNGSGKSSLLEAIMGLPPFELTGGQVFYDGEDISSAPIDERAARGVGMAFQRPPALVGVTISEFADALGAGDRLGTEAEALNMARFTDRDVLVGFSVGDIKRW